jgi:dienelactone hydrolase
VSDGAPAREEIRFDSHGETCAAWHLRGEGDAYAGAAGRPCVVMAHGLAGTRDSGLLPFAEEFAGAGLDALLFDYRCFGDSSGEPRQLASPPRHRQDYQSAVECARALPAVDPDRIVLWGTSWSGGHVVYAAAADPRIAAAIAQTPDLDGVRTLGMIRRYAGVGQLVRLTWHGLRDRVPTLFGASPHMIPVVGPPGTLGAMTSEGSDPGYRAIAGPSWRNELTARALLYEALNQAIGQAHKVRCPLLIQVAERDSVAATSACEPTAQQVPDAELVTYPIAHFEVYLGEGRERALADQLDFLGRRLQAGAAESAPPV